MENNIIYEKRYPKLTTEDYEQMLEETENEQSSYKRPDSATFFNNLMEKTVRIVIPDRMENRGFFIAMAKEVAERNEYDIIITEYEDKYIAEFRIDCNSTYFGLKDLIEYADDISFICDCHSVLLRVIYYTHATYRSGKRITPDNGCDYLT